MKMKYFILTALALCCYAVASAEDGTTAAPAAATPTHKIHPNHTHKHGKNCGHEAVKHEDHVDYKDGTHFHKRHQNHYDECTGPQNAQTVSKTTEVSQNQ